MALYQGTIIVVPGQKLALYKLNHVTHSIIIGCLPVLNPHH